MDTTESNLERLLAAILASSNKQLAGMALTAILTGLGKDRILKLHSSDIDFARQIISGKDSPTIPLPDQLVLLYKRNLKAHASGYVFENTFTCDRFSNINFSWFSALEKAGIEDTEFDELAGQLGAYRSIAKRNPYMMKRLMGFDPPRGLPKYSGCIV